MNREGVNPIYSRTKDLPATAAERSCSIAMKMAAVLIILSLAVLAVSTIITLSCFWRGYRIKKGIYLKSQKFKYQEKSYPRNC